MACSQKKTSGSSDSKRVGRVTQTLIRNSGRRGDGSPAGVFASLSSGVRLCRLGFCPVFHVVVVRLCQAVRLQGGGGGGDESPWPLPVREKRRLFPSWFQEKEGFV